MPRPIGPALILAAGALIPAPTARAQLCAHGHPVQAMPMATAQYAPVQAPAAYYAAAPIVQQQPLVTVEGPNVLDRALGRLGEKLVARAHTSRVLVRQAPVASAAPQVLVVTLAQPQYQAMASAQGQPMYQAPMPSVQAQPQYQAQAQPDVQALAQALAQAMARMPASSPPQANSSPPASEAAPAPPAPSR